MAVIEAVRPVREAETETETATIRHSRSGANASVHARRAGARARDWLVAELTPPRLWVESRPLSATWRYAHEGQQHGSESAARVASRLWALACIPLRAALLTVDWLIERPARLLAALVVYTLLAFSGLGGFLPLF